MKGIVNHKIQLLKTSVIVKLNLIISDIKNKSNIGDVYNYNGKDQLFMIDNNLENRPRDYKTKFKSDVNLSDRFK